MILLYATCWKKRKLKCSDFVLTELSFIVALYCDSGEGWQVELTWLVGLGFLKKSAMELYTKHFVKRFSRFKSCIGNYCTLHISKSQFISACHISCYMYNSLNGNLYVCSIVCVSRESMIRMKREQRTKIVFLAWKVYIDFCCFFIFKANSYK